MAPRPEVLVALAALTCSFTASAFLSPNHVATSSSNVLVTRRRIACIGRRGATIVLSTKKPKTLAEELDDLRLDESTLSETQKKDLQSFRDTYKLDGVLDFEGKGGEVIGSSSSVSRKEDDPDYDPLDDAEDLSIEETKWSGQAGLDIQTEANNNWADIASRPLLAFGDVGFLLLFATIGRSVHSGGFSFDVQTLITAAPFLLSWFAVAPLLGAYTPDATRSTGDAFVSLLKAWIVAVPLGLAGRGLIKGEVPPTPFIGVAMVMTLVFLGGWRSLYVTLSGSEVKGQEGNKKSGVLDIFRMVTTLINRW